MFFWTALPSGALSVTSSRLGGRVRVGFFKLSIFRVCEFFFKDIRPLEVIFKVGLQIFNLLPFLTYNGHSQSTIAALLVKLNNVHLMLVQ